MSANTFAITPEQLENIKEELSVIGINLNIGSETEPCILIDNIYYESDNIILEINNGDNPNKHRLYFYIINFSTLSFDSNGNVSVADSMSLNDKQVKKMFAPLYKKYGINAILLLLTLSIKKFEYNFYYDIPQSEFRKLCSLAVNCTKSARK